MRPPLSKRESRHIVRVDYGGDPEVRAVKYFGADGYAAFDLEGNDMECNALSAAYEEAEVFEIIGNIYENPELLKSKEL